MFTSFCSIRLLQAQFSPYTGSLPLPYRALDPLDSLKVLPDTTVVGSATLGHEKGSLMAELRFQCSNLPSDVFFSRDCTPVLIALRALGIPSVNALSCGVVAKLVVPCTVYKNERSQSLTLAAFMLKPMPMPQPPEEVIECFSFPSQREGKRMFYYDETLSFRMTNNLIQTNEQLATKF